MPEQSSNIVQVPLHQLNEYLQKGYRPAPLQQYELENTMPREEEMGLAGSVGRGLVASGLDVIGAGANWSRAAAQITKLQPLENIGFSVDKYVDDLIARKFSLPPDVKDFDPTDSRWWGYHIARMAPQIGVQYGIMAGLAAFGVPAPIGRALGSGFGFFMEGAGAIEESLAKGDRGWAPITKGLGMGSAALLTNYISMGNVGKVGGSGIFGKLLRMSVSGGWEMGTEAIEEPINDLIVYGRLQPNLLKRMAIVGLPSFVLGSGTHVISRLGQAEPTTKPPDESEGFTATGTGGVPVYSTGEPIVPPSTPTVMEPTDLDVEPEGETGRVIPPWMLTSSEYVGEIDPSIPPAIRQPNGRMAPNPAYQAAKANRLRKLVEHAKHVRDAVDRGEVVPPSILREYATGKNARDWAIAAYRKAVGTEPTGTQPTQAAQPVAPGEVESKDINVSVTPEGDLAIDHIEAIEAAELPLPPESVARQFTTKEQELIIGNELLQNQPELTPEEFDSIVDDLIAAGELSSDTLKAAEWLEIAKYVRTMTGVRGNAKPGDIAVNAVRRARRDFAMPSISYMDAMKLKSLIEQVTGWSITIGDFLRQVGSREGQLNIRAPHFIPGVNKVFTPTQEAQLLHFFGRRLTTDHQRATFVRLLERLVWNAMHSIGFNPVEYFKNSFLGFHNEISSTEYDSPLGLPYGFSDRGFSVMEHAGTMPVYQGENDIIDISKRLEPGPRPSTDTSMEGSPVVISNPSDPISTSIGIKGSASSYIAFHEFGHMFDVLTGVEANVPEVADSPLYAALKRLYGAPFRKAYHWNFVRSVNELEDFAEFIEAFVWNDEGVLQLTGNREIDDAIKDFRAFQDVQKDIYKETPSNPAPGTVPISPFMRAVMQALFTGSSMTVFYRTDIPLLEPGSTFGTERLYKGSRHTAMDSPLDVLSYLKGQTEFLERLSSKKSLAMLRKNVKRALSIGLQNRLSELPKGVKATEQEVMDAILKYADGVATILDRLIMNVNSMRFFLNNATVYTAEERNSYLKELESYREIARKFSTSFTEVLASEYNKLAKTNNAPDFYSTWQATKIGMSRRLLKPDKSSGYTEVEPPQSEFLTPSDRELRRKDRLVKTFAKKAITRAQLNDPKFVAERDAKIEEYIRAGFLDEETLITAKIKLIVEAMEGYLSTSTSIPIPDVLTELMKQLTGARLTFEDATILHRLLRDKFAKPGTREWQFNYFLEQIGELNKASQPAIDIKMPAAPNYSLPKPDYVLPFGVRKQLEYLLNRSIVHSKEAIDACIRTIDRFYHNTLSSSNVKNPRAFLHKHFHGFSRSPGYIPEQDADAASAPTITGYALPQEPHSNALSARFDPTSFDAFMGVVVKDVSFSTLIREVTQHIQFVAEGMPGSQLGEALRRIYKTDIQHEDMPYLMEALILNGTFLQLNGPNLDPILQQDLRLIRDELLAYFNIAKVAVTPTAQATFLMNALLGGDSIIPLVYDLDVGVLPLESRKSTPDPDLSRMDDLINTQGAYTPADLTGSYGLDPDLALLAELTSDQDIANVDFDARLGDTATADELIRSYRKRPPHHIVDKSGKPFNLRTVAGQKGFLASLHTPGHWDEWESSGRELARALVSEGNPVDIIADWISKGRAMNTRIMSALHHIHLLVNYTLPPVDMIEDEIIRQNLAIPGRAMFIEELVKRTKSESGRMLNEGKRQVQLEGAVKVLDGLIAMEKLLPRIKPNSKVYLEFREKLVRSEEPLETLNEFLQLYEKSKVAHNVIMSLFYNSLLSNPSTHVANTLFNGVWGLALSPHRAVVGMVDSVWSAVTGRPRTVFAGEGLSLLRGYAAHFRDPEWNKAFKTMWSREGMIDSITKTEEEMGLVYRGELRKDAITAFLEGKGSVAKLLGNVVTAPSRFLIAMDAWAKAIAERGQEEALRYRFTQYTGEQLTRAKIDFIKTSLSNLRLSDVMLRRYNIRHVRHLNVILEDEVDIGRRIDNLFEAAIKNEMARFAEHATFQDEPGAMTRALLSLRSRSGPLGRMLVPFLQTIMNITKRGLELTPGVGVLMGVHQSLSPQEIAAKQIESLILTAIIYSLLQSGKITGPPPEDPGEREVFYAAGMQPWAIRVGDKYYSYRSIEPFGLPISIITEQYGKWVNQEDERLSLDTFLSSFITVRDHLVGNTFLRTVDAMLGKEWDLKNQLWWTTASFVPFSGFWRGMKRQYEDWAYDKVAIRDNTFMSVFGDSLPPGLAGLVQGEPKISAMGEPIYRENAGLRFLPREWLPIRATEYKPDRVEQLLMDVGYYPRYPGQKIKLVDKGPYVTIPDDLYKDYIIAVGQKGKRELDRLASRPYFNSIPTKRKTDLVISTWNKVRDREREKVKVMLRRQRITSKAYGSRADGTLKGKGFLGELSIGKGRVATEYSIGVKIDGKETEIPSLVPTLTQAERELMLTDIIPNKKTPPTSIIQKAVDHAKKRMRQGLSPFAE